MSEMLPGRPERERTEAEIKEREAEHLASITGYLIEARYGEITSQQAWDWAHDDIVALCESLAKRDPEIGLYLLKAIETHKVASTEPDPAEPIRRALGLPVPDYMPQPEHARHAAESTAHEPNRPGPSDHEQ